jgi:hypothetical protein
VYNGLVDLALHSVKIGAWDVGLALAVCGQAGLIAYLRDSKSKALVLTFPVPSTIAVLATGRYVDVTNAAGLVVLLLFTHGVRLLHYGLRVPIVVSIAVSAVGYCAISAMLASRIPITENAFWLAVAVNVVVAVVLMRLQSPIDEPGHRSPMPVYWKMPLIALVVGGLVLLKHVLAGFITVFPMVGVTAAYEARYSLRTICAQIPVLMITLSVLMSVCHLLQRTTGIGWGLFWGWVGFSIAIVLLSPEMRPRFAARTIPD